jgi:hypothetical protein
MPKSSFWVSITQEKRFVERKLSGDIQAGIDNGSCLDL